MEEGGLEVVTAMVPNPGGTEARDLGCTCPTEQNNLGIKAPTGFGWWIDMQCQVHAAWLSEQEESSE